MTNLEKVFEVLTKEPETGKKLTAEIDRLVESKEASDRKEAAAKVVKTELGIDLTQEELDTVFSTAEETGKVKMDLNELENVSGGAFETVKCFFAGHDFRSTWHSTYEGSKSKPHNYICCYKCTRCGELMYTRGTSDVYQYISEQEARDILGYGFDLHR